MGKIRTRCQVCDGPIANGRCKLCGMPYQNDEILYHLNESREEHYRHASAKARDIMRQEEMSSVEKKAASQAKAAQASKASKSRNTAGKAKGTQAGYKSKDFTRKKKSKAGLVTTVIVCLLGIVPNIADVAREKYEDVQLSRVLRDYSIEEETMETGAVETEAPEEENEYRLLSRADGIVKVGEWCPAGEYMVYVKRGNAELAVDYTDENGTGHYESYILEEGNRQTVVLEEGQAIHAANTDTESRLIRLERIGE